MDLRVVEKYSLIGVGTHFGQPSLLRSTAGFQRDGVVRPIGRWVILSVDRMSGNAIRRDSDITMGLESEDESSNNQDKRDEHLERKRRTFHDDDEEDEESVC